MEALAISGIQPLFAAGASTEVVINIRDGRITGEITLDFQSSYGSHIWLSLSSLKYRQLIPLICCNLPWEESHLFIECDGLVKCLVSL
jgi:hypothetical protein